MTLLRGTPVRCLVIEVAGILFKSGCEVCQGDPLSSAILVLINKPMRCYLRAELSITSLTVLNDDDPHLLLTSLTTARAYSAIYGMLPIDRTNYGIH